MTLENDAKFEENAYDFKNDITSLVNFNESSDKSENLRFDVLLFWIAFKVSAKKVQKSYLSWHWRVIQTLKKNSLFVWKIIGIWNLMNFDSSNEKSENLHFDGIFLSKVCNVWADIIKASCAVKMTYDFKNDIRNLMNFHTSSRK